MFHVITPLARFKNMEDLIRILKPQKIKWHVITDDDNKTPFHWNEPWIHHSICPNHSIDFWARCNNSINWFIESQEINDEEYYCILNDDDGYENNFFQKLQLEIEKVSSHNNKYPDLIITSMKRGHKIPDNLPPLKKHPIHTLIAKPQNMKVCSVGVEQFFIKGKLLKKHRLPLTPYGDGELIVELVKHYKPLYLPHLYVLFNFLEPGRWIQKKKMPNMILQQSKPLTMPSRLQKYLK